MGVAMTICAAIDVAYPLMTRYAYDNFVLTGSLDGIAWFSAGYVFLLLLQGYTVYRFIERAGRLEMDMSYDIRDDGFRRLQELSFSFYDRTPVGYLLARMVSDVSRLSELVAWGFIDFFWAVMVTLSGMAAMLLLNPTLALVILAAVPPLAVISVWFQRRILEQQREARRINSHITGAFNEGVIGAATTKTLVLEAENFGEFEKLTSDMRRVSVRSQVLSAIYMPIVFGAGSSAAAVILALGGGMAASGAVGLGTLAAFITYATQIFEPVQSLARVFTEMQSAQASAERVLSLIATESDITETPDVIAKYGDNFCPKRQNWPEIKGSVEFENVSFGYKGGERVLEDFSLRVTAGETVALVGETGAGKSTLVNLICRFYEPQAGRILIDGADYRERSSLWLQESLGYVLQAPHLFSGTIADNIKYGKKSASHGEVVDAAKLAFAHGFIEKLEKGYYTEVGEGGALLSTGQKQLISIARVILAKPRIFVLDEATSSVDTETERLIQNAISEAMKGRTSFLVAHRLSTIRSAGRILVIRGGRIVEEGRHDELMDKRGYYHTLYTSQFRREKQRELLGENDA
jgi:ATP-binding cassette subfamily B protein